MKVKDVSLEGEHDEETIEGRSDGDIWGARVFLPELS